MAIEHKLILKKSVNIQHLMDYCCDNYIDFEVVGCDLYINKWELNITFLVKESTSIIENIWKSDEFDTEFQYNQVIIFRLGENVDYWEQQTKFVLDYVFNQMMKENNEGIFLYNYDLEICYFKNDGTRIINDKYAIIDKFL